MSEVTRFFNDGSYTANDVNNNFYNMLKQLSGIIVSANNDNNDLLHSSSASYQSTIKPGIAWKDGAGYENSSDALLNHTAVTNTYKRIDRIVFRLGLTAANSKLTVIEGVETTGTPSAPAITAASDIMVSQVLIDNSTGTPAYTITDERQFVFYSDSKKFYTIADLTLPGVYGDLEIYINSAVTARTVNISAGAICNNSGSGQIASLFPKAFVKNLGAATATLRIKSGGTGTGYDITLLTNEWVLLHWDSLGWFIIADGFTTEKAFTITATGAGNHTVPAGRRSLRVIVTGGGASGRADSTNAGNGGGAGGTAIAYLGGLTPAGTVAYVVGAGGAAVAPTNNGNTGGTSSFNVTITATGGSGGIATPLGGQGSGGSVNIYGGDANNPAGNVGGNGGASFWGGGGMGRGSTTAGNAGRAYGAGGGGSFNANSGAGADGVIYITYGDYK